MERLTLVAAVLAFHLAVAIGYRYLLFRQLDGDDGPAGIDAGRPHRDGTDASPVDGTGPSGPDDPAPAVSVRCPVCGTENRRHFRYCRGCAGRLAGGG